MKHPTSPQRAAACGPLRTFAPMAAFVACEASTVVARRRARLRAGGPVRSAVGGRRCAPTALRCSVSWPVAELAARAALAALRQLRRVSLRGAHSRAATSPVLLGAAHSLPNPPARSLAAALSFPRRRESSVVAMDPRLRGDDGHGEDADIGPPPTQPGPKAVPSGPAPHAHSGPCERPQRAASGHPAPALHPPRHLRRTVGRLKGNRNGSRHRGQMGARLRREQGARQGLRAGAGARGRERGHHGARRRGAGGDATRAARAGRRAEVDAVAGDITTPEGRAAALAACAADSTSSSTTPAARRPATSATGTATPGSRRSTPTCSRRSS